MIDNTRILNETLKDIWEKIETVFPLNTPFYYKETTNYSIFTNLCTDRKINVPDIYAFIAVIYYILNPELNKTGIYSTPKNLKFIGSTIENYLFDNDKGTYNYAHFSSEKMKDLCMSQNIPNFDDNMYKNFLNYLQHSISPKSESEIDLSLFLDILKPLVKTDWISFEKNIINFLNALDERIKSMQNQDYWDYDEYKRRIEEHIKRGAKQIILTGAPGTGKTRIAQEIAQIGAKLDWKPSNSEESPRFEFVQFHPSYDYTDFIEGLRPVETNKGIEFQKVDGIFKSFCRHVAEKNKLDGKKENLYFFIIDEINRADLSKVFGELMYCLESDKRGNCIQTQYQLLPTYNIKTDGDVFKNGFFIPENVIIIGTMNDIDRSVESMDFALRRRFLWLEVKVTEPFLKSSFYSILKNEFGTTNDDNSTEILQTLYDISKFLAKKTETLNKELIRQGKKYGLTEQYFISQGQFTDSLRNFKKSFNSSRRTSKEDIFKEAYDWRIKPLLREYLRGETESEIQLFLESCEASLKLESDVTNNKTISDSQQTDEQ